MYTPFKRTFYMNYLQNKEISDLLAFESQSKGLKQYKKAYLVTIKSKKKTMFQMDHDLFRKENKT